MDLLTCLVQSSNQAGLIDVLRNFMGPGSLITELELPCPVTRVVDDPETAPTTYVVNGSGDWTVMEINSLHRLHELGKEWSSRLQCYFLQLMYVDVVEYAYFLLYKDGQLLREIEGRGNEALPVIDIGQWMPAEWPGPIQYFDLDMISELAAGLGLDISNLFSASSCLSVSTGTHPRTIPLDDRTAIESLLAR